MLFEMLGQTPSGLLEFLSGSFNSGNQNISLFVGLGVVGFSQFFLGHLQAHFSASNGAFKLGLLLFRADFSGRRAGLCGSNNICSGAGVCFIVARGVTIFSGGSCLGFFGSFARGSAFGFFISLCLFHALLMKLKALASMVRFYFFCPGLLYLTFAVAIVLHQRNIAGAHIGSGATFNTVK